MTEKFQLVIIVLEVEENDEKERKKANSACRELSAGRLQRCRGRNPHGSDGVTREEGELGRGNDG